MTEGLRFSKPFRWILPGLVMVLLALLGARLALNHWPGPGRGNARAAAAPRAVVPSSAPARAPAATVPPPVPLTLADIPAPPRWSQIAALNRFPKLEFTLDLDHFAPLGDGPANAAVWFRDFARNDGSRAEGLRDADLGTVTLFGSQQKVYAPDHPLLREAEPWVDQAGCSFYPEIWKPAGFETPVPNLLMAVNLARSWAARGEQEKDPGRAKEDFRRAIRLGRLFLQDDMTLIQHLVGWSCVSYGLSGLNEAARREGDAVMVAATTLALGDYNAMRDIASRWVTEVRIEDAFREMWWGWNVSFEDAQLDRVIERATSDSLRCLRSSVPSAHGLFAPLVAPWCSERPGAFAFAPLSPVRLISNGNDRASQVPGEPLCACPVLRPRRDLRARPLRRVSAAFRL